MEENGRLIHGPRIPWRLKAFFGGRPGILYLRHFVYSPNDREVVVGVPNNSRIKIWLNGELIHETVSPVPLRPNYSGDKSNYTTAKLREGWNHFMIKIIRNEKPLKAHFIIASEKAEWNRGFTDLIRCRFPWE